MKQEPSASRPAAPGTIDFEFTDLADARRSLDELPPGLVEAATLEPGYWEKRRRRPQPSDRALSSATIGWLLGLAPEVRPHALCNRFPRLGNEIAKAWVDTAARTRLLDSLLQDTRSRRDGFPSEICREIEALRKLP